MVRWYPDWVEFGKLQDRPQGPAEEGAGAQGYQVIQRDPLQYTQYTYV